MLRLLRRRSKPAVAPAPSSEGNARSLASCKAGLRATVLGMHCNDVEACRLRALGLCEGSRVEIMEGRGVTLLEVRGARLAVGTAIAAGITVLPLQS
ncbi:MAG TPA: FeoA family protein [Gemmatimonadaceae bacterium]|nr:FeoA family protein [Gemmatimonadaceae bacterium]